MAVNLTRSGFSQGLGTTTIGDFPYSNRNEIIGGTFHYTGSDILAPNVMEHNLDVQKEKTKRISIAVALVVAVIVGFLIYKKSK